MADSFAREIADDYVYLASCIKLKVRTYVCGVVYAGGEGGCGGGGND